MVKLLGIDPSSTLTGYAVMTHPTALIEAGLLRPGRVRDKPLDRVRAMAEELAGLIDHHKPDRVIVEVTTGKVAGRLAGHSNGSGMGVYGMAAGVMWWQAYSLTAGRCEPIEENRWTRGVSKRDRQAAVAASFRAYARMMDADRGMDVADAIGLLLWWYSERAVLK